MPSQPIRRNVPRQVLFLAGAAACVGIAVWAFLSIDFALAKWGIVVVAGIVAILLWGYGTGTAGVVDCPHCGKQIDQVDPKTNHAVLCPHCLEFSTGERRVLDVTPDAYVARLPVFGAMLPTQLTWPEGCAVCERPATRSLESKLVDERPGSPGRDLAVGIASLGVLKAVDRTTYTINVPHCQEHDEGVELVTPSEVHLPVALAFRSYAYYRKFRAANHVPACRLMVN